MTANKTWWICRSLAVLYLQIGSLFVLQNHNQSLKLAKLTETINVPQDPEHLHEHHKNVALQVLVILKLYILHLTAFHIIHHKYEMFLTFSLNNSWKSCQQLHLFHFKQEKGNCRREEKIKSKIYEFVSSHIFHVS